MQKGFICWPDLLRQSLLIPLSSSTFVTSFSSEGQAAACLGQQSSWEATHTSASYHLLHLHLARTHFMLQVQDSTDSEQGRCYLVLSKNTHDIGNSQWHSPNVHEKNIHTITRNTRKIFTTSPSAWHQPQPLTAAFTNASSSYQVPCSYAWS